ncbi:MAG: hypothetical protein CL917_03495 [Deltaproteobacteria bacterium]|nr:hypothetical protein [Deltaproteobacteria bacterium]
MGELDVRRVRPLTVSRYLGLTFPAYREFLRTHMLSPHVFAFAAHVADVPVALVLVGDLNGFGPAVRSIYVSEGHRNEGIASELLRQAEAESRSRGWKQLRAVFMGGNSSEPFLRALLSRHGWEEPQTRTHLLKLSREKIVKAPWLKRRRPLPDAFEYFRWVDLGEREKEKLIQVQRETGWPDREVFPFHYSDDFEPESSFGLRFEGEVVGWAVNHVFDEKTIRFTCSYLKEELQSLGRLVELYAQSVDRILKFTDYDFALFTVPVEYPSMVRFAERHLRPYSVESKRSFITQANLS